jgi:hypothetical protein
MPRNDGWKSAHGSAGKVCLCQWFLAQNRQVPLANLKQHVSVKETRGCNQDCIDIFSVQGLADIRECHRRRNRFDRLLGARSVGVDYGRNFGSGDSARQTLDMIGTH